MSNINILENDTVKQESSATPMMKQYLEIKQVHKNYLLFYRMGDFYELFFDDAVIASEVLDIALTKRGKHNGQDIPMCGVPVHSSDSYLNNLIRKGYKVAVCEQLEDPAEAKKRGYKAVVKRDVVRIITSGTLTEDTLLESSSSNFLAAMRSVKNDISLAWVDISTGDFFVSTVPAASMSSELSRINPKEILIPDKLLEDKSFREVYEEWKNEITTQVSSFFDSSKGERKIKQFFGVVSLDSFGDYSRGELGTCGALLEYIDITQKGKLPRLDYPRKFIASNFMTIDSATRKNLEIFCTISGERKGSLLNVIDSTVSSAGIRLLQKYLSAPLLDVKQINERLNNVSFFINAPDLRKSLRSALKHAPDVERALSRICVGRGNPRDLAAIRDGIEQSLHISELIEFSQIALPDGIKKLLRELGEHSALYNLLKVALMETPSVYVKEGGFIREGFHPKLDEYRNVRKDSETFKNNLRDKYRTDTGIDNLKIIHNNILGYFIEVTSQKSPKVPSNFVHRQTLATVVRYTTDELRELEQDIINSESYAIELEMEIFNDLVDKVKKEAESVARTAKSMAGLDVFSAFAELAIEKNYCRPKVNDDLEFGIIGGRHPVVEISASGGFVKNNCEFSEEKRMWLVTGPNMAGKSTFLRQNALIAIMAQIGCYVPADEAHIGLVDRVFSRVGAADDLARGRSTFMVEMMETATILNNATKHSLVILDEVGRGTSTFDGLSIAWAVVEYIHNVNKCRCLFATHYHELTTLSSKLSSIVCYTMKVQEWMSQVIFLHEVISGVADRSYGIYVAKLAGLPQDVIDRAKEILKALQSGEPESAITGLAEDLPLFSLAGLRFASGLNNKKEDKRSEIEEIIKEIEVDDLTPKEALELLYKLKNNI